MHQSVLYKSPVLIAILVIILTSALAIIIFVISRRRPARIEYYRLSPVRDRKTGQYTRLDNYSVENIKFETVTGQIKPAHLYRKIFRQDSIGAQLQTTDREILIKDPSRTVTSTPLAEVPPVKTSLANKPEQSTKMPDFILYKTGRENRKLSAVLRYINVRRLVTAIKAADPEQNACIYCKILLPGSIATEHKKTAYTEAYFIKPPEDRNSVITSIDANILEKDGIIVLPGNKDPAKEAQTGYLVEDLFTAPEFNFNDFVDYFSWKPEEGDQPRRAELAACKILIPSNIKNPVPPNTEKALAHA